jgi:tellurite methyltransferase
VSRTLVSEDLVRRLESFYDESPHPWGEEPDTFVVQHVEAFLPGSVLDLGAGDGRNALFLARAGFKVIAVDAVEGAITRLRRSASEAGLEVETHVGDIARFSFAPSYANVISTVTLHFLPKDEAPTIIARAKECTAQGGLHAVSLFTADGPLHRPSSHAFWLEPGELRSYYEGWDVLHFERRVVTTAVKDERGQPFAQPLDELVVRKPG